MKKSLLNNIILSFVVFFLICFGGENVKAVENGSLSHGAIDASTGEVVSSVNRSVTEQYDLSQNKVTVSVGNSGARYGVFFYDANGKYISWTNWLTGTEYAVPEKASYSRIVLCYKDNRVIGSNELKTLSDCITITQAPIKYKVTNGAVDASGKVVSSANRSVTEQYDLSQNKVTVSVGNSGARYGVFFYDANGKYISWTNWLTGTEYAVPEKASYSRIVLCYKDNRVIGSNELKTLSDCITITQAPIKYKVTNGAVDASGKVVSSANRSVTEQYDLSQNKVTVSVGNSGARYGVFFYDANGKYISWTNWLTGTEYAVPEKASYSRIVLCYKDNRVIGSNELKTLSDCITITQAPIKYKVTNGAVDASGKVVSSANRSVTEQYDLSQNKVTVSVGNSGVRYGVFFYDANGKYISWTNWLTGTEYAVPEKASYSRIVLCYKDNRVIGSNELKTLSDCITITQAPIKYKVTNGAVDASGKVVSSANRSVTEQYDLSQNKVTVSVENSGARYGVFFYDANGKYISWTNWLTGTEYAVPEKASYSRIVLCYKDNRVIGSNELKTLSDCITITQAPIKYKVTNGAVDASGKVVSSANRSVTEQYDLSQNKVTVSVENSGARYGVFFYDANGKYISWTNWLTGTEYAVPEKASYSRIVLCYKDNRVIGSNELKTLSDCITITQAPIKYKVTNGAVDASTGEVVSSVNRSVTEQYDLSQNKVTVRVGNSGARYGVFFYDANGKYISWTNWLTGTEYAVPEKASYSRIVLCYKDNRVIGSNELKTLSDCITITQAPIKYKVTNGAVDASTGEVVSSVNRSVTEQYDLSRNKVSVNIGNSGVQYSVFFYDSMGEYIGWTSWLLVNNYKIPEKTGSIRIVFRYPDNRNIGNSELKLFTSLIDEKPVIPKEDWELPII